MLTSLSLVFLLGMLLSQAFQKIRLPGLLGMLLTGMILGPYALNMLDASIFRNFRGFASDCADHYPDARRSVPGHSGLKKSRAAGHTDVLCSGLL